MAALGIGGADAVSPVRILHLEDSPNDAELVRLMIVEEWPDCEVTCVASRFAFVGELHRMKPDLIISDFAMAAFSGLEALKLAKEHAPDTPLIFLSSTIGEDPPHEAGNAAGAES